MYMQLSHSDKVGLLVLAIGAAALAACPLGGVSGCKLVSAIGGEAAYMVIGLLVYVVLSGVLGIRLVSGLALGAALGVFLKVYINLPRPPRSEWLVHVSGPGFPSGHALMSSLFWGIVVAETLSPLALLGGALAVTAVSCSRLVLHVHYPRDVVGGAIIGAVLAALYLVLRRRYSTLRASAIMIASAAPLALLALAKSPSYDSAQHVLGLVLGLAAGLALLATPRGKQSLVEKLGALELFIAFLWSGIGLAAAMVTHSSSLSIIGFAVFAFLAATSRPLALLLRRR